MLFNNCPALLLSEWIDLKFALLSLVEINESNIWGLKWSSTGWVFTCSEFKLIEIGNLWSVLINFVDLINAPSPLL